MILTSNQIDDYWAQGFVVVPDLIRGLTAGRSVNRGALRRLCDIVTQS